MKDLTYRIPIKLTKLLNSFNDDLLNRRNAIEMNATEFSVRLNGSDYDGIRIRYNHKFTTFYFELEYLLFADLISWKYFPRAANSTRVAKNERTSLESVLRNNKLLTHLRKWKNNLVEIESLENPLGFFITDDFIKFYAGEFIEEIVVHEQDEKLPLSYSNREKVIYFITKQIEFLKTEISEIKDLSSEKYNDLIVSQKILNEIQENISRMTVADIKRNWSISLGAIRKWCENQFINFLDADRNSKYDISRSLGSFVGGLFGIPKLDS